ncbi:MAG TPA: hypothetical protein PLF13_09285 [candidate division Zixibacteria bacterium]|nr:hypothetical protein [candidate division Zixibacteria bacterium]
MSSGGSGGAAAGAAVAAAAAARKKRAMQEEEERLTSYNKEDLEGWEFKIVRANTRKFRTAEAVKQLCDEEAKAGWELIEKFDDSRIRFKRPVSRRSQDSHSEIDPYRTLVGLSEGTMVIVILGIIVAVGAVALFISLAYK